MNIVLTGSLGHISKPLAQTLIQKRHIVKVISSKAERQKEIESRRQRLLSVPCKTSTFSQKPLQVQIVYLMEALGAASFHDQTLDYMAAINEIANNYKRQFRNPE